MGGNGTLSSLSYCALAHFVNKPFHSMYLVILLYFLAVRAISHLFVIYIYMCDVCLFSSVAMSGEVFASSTTHSVIWGAGGESPMHRGLTSHS